MEPVKIMVSDVEVSATIQHEIDWQHTEDGKQATDLHHVLKVLHAVEEQHVAEGLDEAEGQHAMEGQSETVGQHKREMDGRPELERQRDIERQHELERQHAVEGQHVDEIQRVSEGQRKVEGQRSVESTASFDSSKDRKRKSKLPTSFLTEEENIKLQEQRKEGVKRARFLALLHVTVSIVSIIVGITTVVIAKRNNTGLPVTHPMTLIAGLSALIISVLAFAVAENGDEYRSAEIEGVTDGFKTLFFFYFFLALPSMLLCLSSIAMSSLATAACWGRRCGPDSPALLALGCLGVICSVAMTTMCVMVIMFFLKFKRAFGLLTDEDRVREMQFRGKMLTKQQSGTSQMSVQSI